MIMCLGSGVFADADGESYEYVYPDGTTVQYFLDENNNPYNYQDGVKTYQPLPLPGTLITDPAILAIVQAGLPENPEMFVNSEGISPYAEPTDFIDIHEIDTEASVQLETRSICSPTESASFAGEAIVNTPIYYTGNNYHSIVLTTTDIISASGGKKINIIYTAYDTYYEKWNSYMYSGKSCGGIGYRMGHGLMTAPYVRFSLNQYDDMSSCKYFVYASSIVISR